MTMRTVQLADWQALPFRTGNRPIDRAHVGSLKRKITKSGYLKCFPIVINPDLEVIDGQHRLIACKELAIEPTFLFSEDLPAAMIADAGTAARRWSVSDRLHSAASQGNATAATILRLARDYSATVEVVSRVIARAGALKSIDHMVITDEDERTARNTLNRLRVFDHVMPAGRSSRDPRIASAYVSIAKMPGFDHERLRERLALYGREKFVRCTRHNVQVRNLVDLYNYRTTDALRLPYPADTHNAAE